MSINLKINGVCVTAKKGQTILDVAKKNNIEIENICFTKRDAHKPICRVCAVEVVGVDGLVPSCSTKVTDGMVVTTHSDDVVAVRADVLDMIMSETVMSDGVILVDLSDESIGAKKAVALDETIAASVALKGSDFIGIDPQKCIHCDKCIIACPNDVISRAGRGNQVTMTFGKRDQSLDLAGCTGCGDCVRVCSTGAIYEK